MFKPGDKVICINPSNMPLLEGVEYTISEYINSKYDYNALVCLVGRGTTLYFAERFVLASDYKPKEIVKFKRKIII